MLKFEDVVLSGGTGRSGTTIVGKLLARHSQFMLSRPAEIKIMNSGNGLLDIHLGNRVGRYRKLLLTDWLHLQRFNYQLWHEWWTRPTKTGGLGGLNKGIELEEFRVIYDESLRIWRTNRSEGMRHLFRNLVDSQKFKSGKSNWIETSPTNLYRALEISEFLPGVRFVHMVRDGRDVISSVIRENWGPKNYEEGLKWWRKRMKRNLENSEVLPGKVLTLSIENLAIGKRNQEYSRLLNFLGLSEDPIMRSYFENEVRPEKVSRGRWQKEVKDVREFNLRYFEIVEELKSIDEKVPLSI